MLFFPSFKLRSRAIVIGSNLMIPMIKYQPKFNKDQVEAYDTNKSQSKLMCEGEFSPYIYDATVSEKEYSACSKRDIANFREFNNKQYLNLHELNKPYSHDDFVISDDTSQYGKSTSFDVRNTSYNNGHLSIDDRNLFVNDESSADLISNSNKYPYNSFIVDKHAESTISKKGVNTENMPAILSNYDPYSIRLQMYKKHNIAPLLKAKYYVSKNPTLQGSNDFMIDMDQHSQMPNIYYHDNKKLIDNVNTREIDSYTDHGQNSMSRRPNGMSSISDMFYNTH